MLRPAMRQRSRASFSASRRHGSVCFVILGDQDLAQDAVQAAWPIAWRKLDSVRKPYRLRSWLLTVAANEARHLARRRRRDRVVEIEVADVGSDGGDPDARPEVTDLVVAIRRLGSEDRALLALRYVAGFDATEIGRSMSMSPSGVRSKLARLTARLRRELGDA
jgi:RNA polymerase sigma-70 factor (ECF subfamily)